MVKKLTALVLALLALAGGAAAQNDPESAFAGIFRGKLPGVYPYKYNGTYYWDRKEFQQGDVCYNGRMYRDVSLNIDACKGELQVRPMEKATAVVVFTDQVAWFTMGGKSFVNLQYLGWKDAPEGFFEVIRDGETPLLRQVEKTLRFDGTNGGASQIGYTDPDFNPSIPNFFMLRETFYALEQGKLVKINRRNLNRRLQAPAGNPTLNIDQAVWHSHSDIVPTGKVAEANLPGTGIGLPDGYFSEVQQDTVVVQYVDNPLLATYRNKVYSVGNPAMNKGNGAIIPSLKSGSINMILAGMSSTAERRETIDFTDPYLESDLAFLIRAENLPAGNSASNPASYQDLLNLFNGKSLVCQSGVVGDDIIEDYFVSAEGVSINHSSPLPTYPLAALDVQQGISFAMPAELPVVEAMANLEGLAVLYCDYSFLSEGDLEGLKVNIGIKKGNDELRNDLNASLGRLSQARRSEMMGAASQRSAA